MATKKKAGKAVPAKKTAKKAAPQKGATAKTQPPKGKRFLGSSPKNPVPIEGEVKETASGQKYLDRKII